jgi:SAM-dependent methyltransferase
MDKNIYNELRKKWDAINELKLPYLTYGGAENKKPQYTYYKVKEGEKKFEEKNQAMKHLNLLKDKVVIDIGCNAGYITYHIAEHAKGWIGVERDEHFYAQALETAKYIDTPGKFIHSSIKFFCEFIEYRQNYDALFGSNILYYLSNDDLDLLRNNVLSKCDLVMLTSREDKPIKKWNDYSLSKHVNIQKYLEDGGFTVEVLNADTNWATVIGRK